MTNEQMREGRYLRWHRARQRVAWIRAQLDAGRLVQVTTMLRATRYDRRHIDWFRATRSGAYVRRGRGWECIDYCDIQAFAVRQ